MIEFCRENSRERRKPKFYKDMFSNFFLSVVSVTTNQILSDGQISPGCWMYFVARFYQRPGYAGGSMRRRSLNKVIVANEAEIVRKAVFLDALVDGGYSW